MEQNPAFTKTNAPISPAQIVAITEAMQETGINPTEFLALFSVCNPLQALSHFRHILFRALYEIQKADAATGSYSNELAEHTCMLYDMFYETEATFIQTEDCRRRQEHLQKAMQQ
jgi:hypothetical protein